MKKQELVILINSLFLFQLSAKCAQHEVLAEQFKELQNKYDAMLLMYGEKVEEAQELRLDLQEAREAYKTQIDELSFRLERDPLKRDG